MPTTQFLFLRDHQQSAISRILKIATIIPAVLEKILKTGIGLELFFRWGNRLEKQFAADYYYLLPGPGQDDIEPACIVEKLWKNQVRVGTGKAKDPNPWRL